jgi:hypothetical protein
MPDPTPKTRTRRPLTIGTALDKLMALEREKHEAHVAMLLAAHKKHLEKRDAILKQLSAEDANKVVEAVNVMLDGDDDEPQAGSIGGFGVDPKDSAALLELRELIDEIGWPSFAAEEAADYPARLLQLAEERRSLARKWYAWDGGAEIPPELLALLSQIHGEVSNPHPDPLPEDGARAVKPEIPELDPVPPAFRQPVPPPKPGERIEVVRK